MHLRQSKYTAMCPEEATHNSVWFQATGHLTRPEEDFSNSSYLDLISGIVLLGVG